MVALKVLLAFLAVALIHLVDWAYFRFLHGGLKYPDYFVFMGLAIVLAWKGILRRPLADLGLDLRQLKPIAREFLAGALRGGGLALACMIAGLILGNLELGTASVEPWQLLAKMAGYLVFVPLSAALEELHYRGVYLSALKSPNLRIPLVVFSSAVFSIVHLGHLDSYPPTYPISLFLLGVLWCLMRIRRLNIAVCIGAHSGWNFLLASLAPFFGDNTERYVEFAVYTPVLVGLAVAIEMVLLRKSRERKA